jgi:predicted O-linked N-acetylglucosamine transferase (SPINDLY family)
MSKKQSKSMKRIKENKRRREVRKAKKQSLLITMPTKPGDLPVCNYSAWVGAIANREPKVWEAVAQYLFFFESHHFRAYSKEAIKQINTFVHLYYTALMDEEFAMPLNNSIQLIQMAHLFQHLVALTGYETNDAVLRNMLITNENLAKLLILQNPRCVAQVDQKKFFDANPVLASMWYQTYIFGLSTPTNTIMKNIYTHLTNMDQRWVPYSSNVTGLYFSSTYHAPDSVRWIKSVMNKGIKEQIAKHEDFKFTNNPEKGNIAIITGKWHRNHAVYKSASPLVEQWKDKYNLSLIWCGKDKPDTAVVEYFDAVEHCWFDQGGKINIPEILRNNNFEFIYFPDIGMTDESVWLSNCRMAPIQAVGYGHPDTTGDNNEIDYFFGGDIEKDAVENAYSETCVLVPGLAQEPAWPTAPKQNNYKDDGIVRVNCVWGPDKYNYTLLTMLAEINKTVEEKAPGTKFEFHLFGSPGMNRYAALPAFAMEVSRMLPNARLHTEQEYYDYMKNAEEHDFTLNSYPFGCYNVLIESLWMGLPFLTLVGTRFYNRAGMYLNEQIGMNQNNFESPRELINWAALLITDPELLKDQRDHLASLDLKKKLFTLEGTHFLEALEYTLANHPFTETKIIGDDK